MGPRQSQQSHEVPGEETTKIQETSLNLGVVNFQEETFTFKRVIESRWESYSSSSFFSCSVYWVKRCKKKRQKKAATFQTMEQQQMAPQIMIQ